MTPSTVIDKAITLLQELEGFEANAYKDVGNVWTIGYGRTTDVELGERTTKERERDYLFDKVEDIYEQLRALHPSLRDNQYVALISFIYNVGMGAYASSTLRKLLRDGKVVEASQQFKEWRFVKKKEIAGLVNRRKREKEVFLSA